MPNLSALFTKFLFRESLSTEEKTTIRSDIGAGTPATAESVLALLEGEAVEVASIGLTDGTGTALAAGSLSLNAAGKVVVHDGLSNSEDLPNVLNSSDCLNFAKKLTAAQMDAASYYVQVARIILPATVSANGNRLNIIGRIQAVWTAGDKPDSVELVIVQEGQDETTEGYLLPLAQGVTSEFREFDLPVTFLSGAGVWEMVPTHIIPAAFVRKNNAGTITHAMGWNFNGEWTTNIATEIPPNGLTSVPVVLELYVRTADAAGTVTSDLYLSGSINAIHE